jgi:hypothetical protein
MSRKQNTDNERMDGQTDGHAESSINPPNFLAGGIMKHCTKFQVFLISHLREVSTIYFKLSTSLGSTITQRKMIGSSYLDIMPIY